MAKLNIYGTPTTSRIRVRIVELDPNWASGERYAHFYISDSGYSTSSSDYDGMLTLEDGIEQSDIYSFTGLESDTKYYISCVIKRGDTGATIVTFTISEWTDEEAVLNLPYFSVANVTATTAYINISNLGNPFNSSYYNLVGVTTGAYTNQGASSIPATVMGTKSAPSSGTARSTGFQVTGLTPGKTYKFYCYAQAANGKFYAISKSKTVESYGITFTTLDVERPNDWTWTSLERRALENSGTTDNISADRWNAFIDRVNEFSDYVRALTSSTMPKVPELAKMSIDGYLYAVDFAAVAEVVDAVTEVASGYPLEPESEDYVFGSYLIKLAEALNSVE